MTETERKAYEAGQRDMRDRAAEACNAKARAIDPFNSAGTCGEIMRPAFEDAAKAIRALEIRLPRG